MFIRSSLRCSLLLLVTLSTQAKEVTDTLATTSGDRVILRYSVAHEGDAYSLKFSATPRVIPSASSKLRKESKGSLDRLKVVIFDRVGDFGATKWKGLTPKAFIKPSEMSYDDSKDGYYILGQSTPLVFKDASTEPVKVNFPLFVALYEKKQNYKLLTQSAGPLVVSFSPDKATKSGSTGSAASHTESVTVSSSVETEADNSDITSALQSIEMVNQLLAITTEVPFSSSLEMELMSLRMMKTKISDPDLLGKINDVLFAASQKEKELTDAATILDQAEKLKEKEELEKQKQEALQQQKAAEEQARQQEEKQQKRSMWMIIGGVLLAVVGFVGNAVFRHFSEVRSQKSILEMQESLTNQAAAEAKRRSREIIRNKAHQAMNKGKNQLRAQAQARKNPSTPDANANASKPSSQSTPSRTTPHSSTSKDKTRRTI
ncbi:MAG: hypothetical protein LIP02_14425 [Bacteroidales bacterium]|nr:hypothetical protein [Bacteroidales bacterium]